MQNNKLGFNLLREGVSKTDKFEDKTHDRIADTLANIIKTENEGLTIGLEGSWGSGKSTVISLLEERVKDKNIKIVKFDSWAHENDPLRRIFLESLINEISEKTSDVFKSILYKISNRVKNVTIKTKQYTTSLGSLLALTAFLMPVGLALMPDDYTFAFSKKLDFYWLFFITLLFTISPLLVLIFNLFRLWFKKGKNIWDCNNWTFLERGSVQDIKQEISEDEERTSIEFENYFEEILKIYFEKKSNDSKLVLVIDNLDRIAPKDSLYLLSTLQTFLQQRNDIDRKPWFKKLWIIIPYDQEGLSSIWEENKNKERNKDKKENSNNNIAKSFFDKNFQIKLEVPKPILSNWINYAKDMINTAIKDDNNETKKIILDVLRFTRKDINDIPTPREIKNYINQVLILAFHTKNTIPIASIAYYVILRQIDSLTKHEIRGNLLENKIPNNKEINILPNTCQKDISGLIFGVSPDKGHQLLLEPEIIKLLQNGDSTELRRTFEMQGDDFWPVFDNHIGNVFNMNIIDLFNYSKTIYETFGTDKKDKYNSFIVQGKENFIKDVDKLRFPKDNIDACLAFLNIFISDIQVAVTFYEQFVETLNSEIKVQENIKSEILKIVQAIVEIYKNPEKKILEVTATGFSKWVKINKELKFELWKYFKPWQKIFENISILIEPNKVFPSIMDSIKYIDKSNEEKDWTLVLNSIQTHINFNNGTFQNHSDEVFEILAFLTFTSINSQSKIQDIITSGQYANLLHHRNLNVFYASVTWGYMLSESLHTINIPELVHSAQGVNHIRNFWKTKNNDNAKKVLVFIKPFNQYHFIWQLLKDEQNLLVQDIINIASKREQKNNLFKVGNYLVIAKLIVQNENLVKDEIFKKIIEQNDDVSKQILSKKDEIDIVEYSEALYNTILHINDAELMEYVISNLEKITKEQWKSALEEDSFLTSLSVQSKNNNNKFELGLNFHDPLLTFCIQTNEVTEWQQSNWDKLVNLQSKTYLKQYGEKTTSYFIRSTDEVSEIFIELNKNHINTEKVLAKKVLLETIIEQSLERKNYTKLQLVLDLFQENELKNYKFDSDKKLIIKDRLKEIKDIEETKNLVTRISEMMKITFDDNTDKKE